MGDTLPTWPPTWTPGPKFKTSATVSKLAKHRERKTLENAEDREKAKVRRRDRGCRFPRCGCKKLGLRLEAWPEVSHDKHKGTNGNATKVANSVARLMVQLCKHRHQDGPVSRHKGTLKTKYLTKAGYDGPVAWLVDVSVLARGPRLAARWVEVAREVKPGVLEPLTERQTALLDQLATMEV